MKCLEKWRRNALPGGNDLIRFADKLRARERNVLANTDTLMTRGDKGQTVPYGTIPRRRVPMHFMPGYPHSAPSKQQAKGRFEKARSRRSVGFVQLLGEFV